MDVGPGRCDTLRLLERLTVTLSREGDPAGVGWKWPLLPRTWSTGET